MSPGPPFLLYRDDDGRQQLLELPAERPRLTIGRRASCDLALPWDEQVSRVHAELVRMGADWVVCDDGLSHNGTFVNGERIGGRRRLRAGDVVGIGRTPIAMCAPDAPSSSAPTQAAREAALAVVVTPAQQRMLAALCRPLLDSHHAAPASNRASASELMLSLDTVKGTLCALFACFGVSDLPQNQKRAALAVRALAMVADVR